jgi:hypothetical protein
MSTFSFPNGIGNCPYKKEEDGKNSLAICPNNIMPVDLEK